MILTACANENIVDPTLNIFSRRVGYQLAITSPGIAEQTRARRLRYLQPKTLNPRSVHLEIS